MNEKWYEKIENKVDKIELTQRDIKTCLSFLVGTSGKPGILLPKCEKETIKSRLKIHQWLIGILLSAIIGISSYVGYVKFIVKQ